MTSVPDMTIDRDAVRDLSRAATKAREWTAERDRRIVAAVKAGASLREVAAVVGLSHTSVANIIKNRPTA